MRKNPATIAIFGFLVLAPSVLAHDEAPPPHRSPGRIGTEPNPDPAIRSTAPARQPRGIYAAYLDADRHPYPPVVENPAISWLYLYFHWATLEPQEGQFDFSRVEEAFKSAPPAGSGYDSRDQQAALVLVRGLNARRPPYP
jgi:hypothetical protein